MDNQQTFISRIRTALGHSPDRRRRPPRGLFQDHIPAHSRARLEGIATRSQEDRMLLLDRLREVASPLQIRVSAVSGAAEASAAIVDLVERAELEFDTRRRVAAWRHPLVDQLNLQTALKRSNVPLTVTDPPGATDRDDADRAYRKGVRSEIARCAVGITSADYCVADTATLVIKAAPGCERSVSLLPTVHVAVITLDQLIHDLGELYAILCWETGDPAGELPHCLTMITGPSKTGDIEAVMVPGVHGPRELRLLVITGE